MQRKVANEIGEDNADTVTRILFDGEVRGRTDRRSKELIVPGHVVHIGDHESQREDQGELNDPCTQSENEPAAQNTDQWRGVKEHRRFGRRSKPASKPGCEPMPKMLRLLQEEKS